MICTALLPSLLVVAHLLAACQPADPPPGEQTPEQAGTSSTYRLLLNSDGGSGSLYAHEPPITPDQFSRVVNELEGTQVDAFIQCFTHGDHLMYDSAVGEIYGKGVVEYETTRRWAQNVFSLLEEGTDPLELLAQRTHALDMEFWLSMRMNYASSSTGATFDPREKVRF